MDEIDTATTDSDTANRLLGAVILGAAIYGVYEGTKTIGKKVLDWNQKRKQNGPIQPTPES